MIVKVGSQFRSTKMSRVLHVYREFWCNNEGFWCKYFIRKLHTELQTLPEIVQAKTMLWEMFGEQNAQRYS